MSALTSAGSPVLVIQPLVQLIVEHFHPQRVILFGSQARGDAATGSDYDLLIIAPSTLPRWQRTAPVYRLLAGTGVAKDIVWWTPEEVAEWQAVRSHFISTALREGVVVYEDTH